LLTYRGKLLATGGPGGKHFVALPVWVEGQAIGAVPIDRRRAVEGSVVNALCLPALST